MKYKKTASENWIVQIDDAGNVSPSFTKKNKPGLWAEYKAWLEAGNDIEPEFTAKELAEKKAREAVQALESQNQTIQTLLDTADKKSSAEYRNSAEDKVAWRAYGDKLLKILKSGIIQEIPPAPF